MTTPATFGSDRYHPDVIDSYLRIVYGIGPEEGGFGNRDRKCMHRLLDLITPPPATAQGWVAEIAAERQRQDAKWGGPQHDDEHDQAEWEQFIIERLAELGPCADTFRHRMLEIAALAVAAMESHDRKTNQ